MIYSKFSWYCDFKYDTFVKFYMKRWENRHTHTDCTHTIMNTHIMHMYMHKNVCKVLKYKIIMTLGFENSLETR